MPLLIRTTLLTPATALALSALKDATLPPNTGERTTRAVSRFGSFTSMPNTAVPLTFSGTSSHPLQRAWVDEQVPQCGYCQSGQIMSAAALLATTPRPTDAQIDAAMAGNICRCGTYQRIRRAIHRAAGAPRA